MKITVLLDNNTLIDRYFIGEPGLSFLLEEEGKRILFDTGYSDAFLQNADSLGEDLLDIDEIVLSHGHLDHSWGLVPLLRRYTQAQFLDTSYTKPTLRSHPAAFEKKLEEGKPIGSLLAPQMLSSYMDLELSTAPVWITDRILFLGEIERVHPFENREPVGMREVNGVLEPDFLLDDTALVYDGSSGMVIITGCSHAGICNIIEQAKRLCGEKPIIDIIGGFHLLSPEESQLSASLAYLKAVQPLAMHPCHCVDLSSKIAISAVCTPGEIGSGSVLQYA